MAHEFSFTTSNKKIHVIREFKIKLPQLWKAWTEKNLLDQWWGPYPWKVQTKAMDFREGGHWLYAMVGPNEERHWSRTDFKKIENQKMIISQAFFCDEEGRINQDIASMQWTIDFSQNAASSRVEITIEMDSEQGLNQILAMGFQQGFTMGLGNLEGLLPDLRINGSGYAPINGIKMYYEIYGDSDQDLVLIHGGGSTIESCFGNAIPFFSDSHRLIALELQAHGHTSDREAPQSYEQDADDIAALMAYLGVEKASFFGFSNGGTAALQIGIRHPGLVDKLIILSAGFQREAFVDGFFDIFPNASIEKTFPEALKKAFLKVCPDQALLENMFEKDRWRMENFKSIPDKLLKSIRSKILVMTADKDILKAEEVVRLSNLLPNGRLIILPGFHGQCLATAEMTGQEGIEGIFPRITIELIDSFLKEMTI